MGRLIKKFRGDEGGATSIEYGIIALIMALGIIASLYAFPTSLNAIWGNVATNLN
jgi:pilus assembly protein Flp/PilA